MEAIRWNVTSTLRSQEGLKKKWKVAYWHVNADIFCTWFPQLLLPNARKSVELAENSGSHQSVLDFFDVRDGELMSLQSIVKPQKNHTRRCLRILFLDSHYRECPWTTCQFDYFRVKILLTSLLTMPSCFAANLCTEKDNGRLLLNQKQSM